MKNNKTRILMATITAISMIALSAVVGCDFKGDNNMATISTIANSEAGSVVRTSINTNFTNINNELVIDTAAIGTLSGLTTTAKTNLVAAINELDANKIKSGYGELWSPTEYAGSLFVSSNSVYSYFTSGLALKTGSGITYDTSALKIGVAGTYLVTYTISVSADTDTSGLMTAVLKNGTALVNGKTSNETKLGIGSITCTSIETFALNDLVKLGFKMIGINTFNLAVYNYQLTITRV